MRAIIALAFAIVFLSLSTTQAQQSSSGAEGLGDPYFPTYGNGGYDAQHYTLDLSVDMEDNVLSGTVTMEAMATQNLYSFHLDFEGFTISEITVNGVAAQDYGRDGRELVIVPASPLANGQTFATAVTYSGIPREGVDVKGDAFALGWQHYDDGVFVASEPFGASLWFPVNDHPLDKATYTFRITVPEPYVVAANGTQQSATDNGDTITYLWEADAPMASYLAAMNIGDFVVQNEQGPGGISIRNYFPRGIARAATRTFSYTSEMIEFFSSIFGPYPFDVYGVAVADKNLSFAMETQTISLFGREIVSPDSWPSAGGPQGVISHELAHQWFGDSVSLSQWQDIWLNEGFATYASLLWFEHTAGRETLDDSVREFYDGFSNPRVFAWGRVTPPGDPPRTRLFNSGVYLLGAVTLHALRLRVGDAIFFDILRTYTERYRYGNVTTADFIAVAEEVSGQQLDEFFDAWLYGRDLPPIPEMGLGVDDTVRQFHTFF